MDALKDLQLFAARCACCKNVFAYAMVLGAKQILASSCVCNVAPVRLRQMDWSLK